MAKKPWEDYQDDQPDGPWAAFQPDPVEPEPVPVIKQDSGPAFRSRSNAQRNQELLQPETGNVKDREESFFADVADAFMEDGTFRGFMDDSINIKAGELLAKKLFEWHPDAANGKGAQLVQEDENSEKFRKWQPQIWDAEDQLRQLSKTSPEYQLQHERVKKLKENFAADMRGEYDPSGEDIDFGAMWDSIKESPGTAIGAMGRAMAVDPALLLVPGTMMKAGATAVKVAKAKKLSAAAIAASKLSAEAASAGTISLGLGVAGDVIEQWDENPDAPIDFNRVANTAIITGAIGTALPFVGAAGKGVARSVRELEGVKAHQARVAERKDAKTINDIQLEAQRIYNNEVDDEGIPRIDKQTAVNIALANNEKRLTPKVNEKLSDMNTYMEDSLLTIRKQRDDANTLANKARRGWTSVKDAGAKVKDGWNALVKPITSELRDMGYPAIARMLDQHDMNVGTQIDAKIATAENFSNRFGELSETDQIRVGIALANGTYDDIAGEFSGPMDDSIREVQEMLRKEHDQMVSLGMISEDQRKMNYFPREVFDYDAFLEAQGVDPKSMPKVFADHINDKFKLEGWNRVKPSDMTQDFINRFLEPEEVNQVISTQARSMGGASDITATSASSQRSRTVDLVDESNFQFYADPRAALHNHITRMTPKIHDKQFFGGGAINEWKADPNDRSIGLPDSPDESTYGNFIDDFANRLQNDKKIRPGDRQKVVDLLKARFIGGNRKAAKPINVGKNLMYLATLGNPISAMVQTGDVGAAMYLNGYKEGVDALLKKVAGKNDFSMEDFGLKSIPEIESMDISQRMLDWGLKYSGFRYMDSLGKETILNSTYSNLRKQMAGPKTYEAKRQWFEERFARRLGTVGDDGEDLIGAIMDGIASGDKNNPYARLALYSDLTRVQPINMSQMPAMYLNHPNGRIMYMLKSFTMKQIDLLRQDVLRNIYEGGAKVTARGEPTREGMRQMRDGMFALAKLGGTIGIANMGVDTVKRWMAGEDVLSDEALMENAVDSALRHYGLSEYTTRHLQRGDLKRFFADTLIPPVNVFTRPEDHIPLIGRPLKILRDRAENESDYGY